MQSAASTSSRHQAAAPARGAVPPAVVGPSPRRPAAHACDAIGSRQCQSDRSHASSWVARSAQHQPDVRPDPPAQPLLHNAINAIQQCAGAALAASLAVGLQLQQAPAAEAVLVSPNANIARSADAALRRSIPAFNGQVKQIQENLEEVQYLLRIPQRKPYGTMANDVEESLAKFQNREQLLEGAPADMRAKAEAALDELYSSLQRLQVSIKTQQPDYVALRVSEALKATAELEVLEAPGLTFTLPKDYQGLPRLVGRAVVEFEFQRGDGAAQPFVNSVKGGLSNTAAVQITLDGYSAPLNAGNFAKQVLAGRFNGRVLDASSTAVVVPSAPGAQAQDPPVPLEILPLGEFEPIYRLPLDVQGGELPVLPLSIPGAVSMTHVAGNDSYLSADEWFMFKFDKQQAGLSGLAFDEGTFSVFGYVTEGMDVVTQLRSGDKIVRATVLSGADKLVLPKSVTSNVAALPNAAAAAAAVAQP